MRAWTSKSTTEMQAVVDTVNRTARRIPNWPLYGLAMVPAVVYFWLALQNRLGADPVKVLEHEYGLIALQFLIAALMVTPIREQLGINLICFRRMLGQLAFIYVVLHFAVWLALDRQLDWPRIAADLVKRPYIILGMAALLMLVPLAATSFDCAIRRMGAASWKRLHRLAYPATALAAIHFVWLVKAWPPQPLIYAAIVALLLGYRLVRARRRASVRATS